MNGSYNRGLLDKIYLRGMFKCGWCFVLIKNTSFRRDLYFLVKAVGFLYYIQIWYFTTTRVLKAVGLVTNVKNTNEA